LQVRVTDGLQKEYDRRVGRISQIESRIDMFLIDLKFKEFNESR